jgi:hypothetical protein
MSIYVGYSASVWQNCYAALTYYQSQLSSDIPPAALASLSEVTLETILNGVDAINAYDIASSWAFEAKLLTEISALPLILDSYSEAIFDARLAAYVSASAALSAIVPPTSAFDQPPKTLINGIPTIPDPGLLEFYNEFSYESAPSGATVDNLAATAQSISQAFTDVANAIAFYQGANNLTQWYDAATRESLAAAGAAYIDLSFTSGPFSGGAASGVTLPYLWNQMATLPAMAMSASVIFTAPYQLSNQQSAVIRYALLSTAAQIESFLLSLRSQPSTEINLTTLYANETLMDVAARALGDFELWPEIATLNNLVPPYTGPVAAPGLAAWGSQIVLPGPTISQTALGQPPSYLANFLGTDLYVGPINGPMPPWNGDFQTITGYNNLAWALGRRLQTTLGKLIYHSNYGSRIPPEVGNIQTQQTAARIAAFGKSAILSDPRVGQVLSATAALRQNGQIAFNGKIQPAGFGTTPISVNETISPLP